MRRRFCGNQNRLKAAVETCSSSQTRMMSSGALTLICAPIGERRFCAQIGCRYSTVATNSRGKHISRPRTVRPSRWSFND